MKRQFINEAFRLQQIAGIKSINTLNEDTPGFNSFMDTVEDFFDEGTPEYERLAAAVEKALESGDITSMPHEPSSYYKQVEQIAKELGLVSEELDAVGHEDADIDNDGDTDKSDKYLAKRRKAISKNMNEGDDHEVAMAHASLKAIVSSASQLMNKIGQEEINIPAWIQDHITNSENYIEQANQGYHELCDKGEYQADVQVAVMEKDEE